MATAVMTAPELLKSSFASSSNFRVAQDNCLSQAETKSVFKKDYVPWKFTSKPLSCVPHHPAEILQKDERYFNSKISETSLSYGEKPLPTLENRPDIHTILRATNFKLDRDLSKSVSFDTTHKLTFTPKYNGPRLTGNQVLDPMGSSVPNGDTEKAPLPISDYRNAYRGHAQARKPDRAVSLHQVESETIKGDRRLHQFGTTHKDTYVGLKLPKVQAFPAPTGTNIPQGDKEKEFTRMTTVQEFFPKHNVTRSYDKASTSSQLHKTNFLDGDGHNTWSDFASTFRDSYRAIQGNFVLRIPSKHRNHSDIPSGDDDPYYAERSRITTNRFYYGNVHTPKAKIISGANIRTKSNVFFGDPEVENREYSTTTKTTFRPKSLPNRKFDRPDFNTRSSIPVDYHPDEVNIATTYADFQDPKSGKMFVNTAAIENLKNSHIKAPTDGELHFSTEHLEQFIPKKTILDPIDAGRLQRSSVPLGTLSTRRTSFLV